VPLKACSVSDVQRHSLVIGVHCNAGEKGTFSDAENWAGAY
jgi:hypothetical protein